MGASQKETERSTESPRERIADFLQSRAAIYVGAALIFIVTILAYRPCLNGKFIWDDDLLVTQNELIRGDDGLSKIWFSTEGVDYWPVTNTSFWIDWRCWQMNPLGYHLLNLGLHLASVFLLWAVLRALAIPGSFLAALLFAVHPVNVESVAWITQRKNVLAIVFYLASILLYLKSDAARGSQMRARVFYGASLLAFLLAMLSKGSVAILPLIVLLALWWRRPIVRGDLFRLAPFALVAAALTLVNIWFQGHGAGEAIRHVTPLERLLGAGGVIWFYLLKSLLPFDLLFIYPQWDVQAANLLWWIPLLAALGASFAIWRLRNGKFGRPLFFAWSTYCVALLPVMGFVDVGYMKYSLVADHYAHLAMISVVAAVAAGVYYAASHVAQFGRAAIAVGAFAAIALLAVSSERLAQLYESPRALFQATVERNPDAWILHHLLGRELHFAGDPEGSVTEQRKAIELHADKPGVFAALGAGLVALGRYPEAIQSYREALDRKPGSADFEVDLASALAMGGDRDAAKALYLKTLEQYPNYAAAFNGLGHLALLENNLPAAIENLKRAIDLKPDDLDGHFNLGIALDRSGDGAAAIEQMEEVLRLQPDYAPAENTWGYILFKSYRFSEAIEHFKAAIRLNPNDFGAYNNLATSYNKTGRPDLAVEVAKAALSRAEAIGNKQWAEKIRGWFEQ